MTKKETTGIYNPFEKPKAKKDPLPSPYEDVYGMMAETQHLHAPPVLSLDGDRYVIRFLGGITPETVAEALVALLYEVNKEHAAHLNLNGIWVDKKEQDCMVLRNPKGIVSIYNKKADEVSTYRRIGQALFTLPTKHVLAQHRVKIMKRG